MNEATQRLFLAGLLTLSLHSAFLFVRHPRQARLVKLPEPEKITVSLRQPQPPKKIISERLHPPPVINATRQRPMPRPPAQDKLVRRLRPAPAIAQTALKPLPRLPAQAKIARRLPLAPAVTLAAAALQPLPHLPPTQGKVARQMRPAPALPVSPLPQPASSLPPLPEPVQVQEEIVQEDFVVEELPAAGVEEFVEQPAVHQERFAEASSYSAGDQEAAPLYASNPPPEYPPQARRRGLQGVVTIEALIDISGRVADLRLAFSSGHSILDNAALKSVRGWLFTPGTVGGRTKEMWVKVPVRFELN